MALWMVRAGATGEHETFALEHGVVVAGWPKVPDLTPARSRETVRAMVERGYPEASENAVTNWTGQLWTFRDVIQVGDIVALPLKRQPALAFARVTGPYRFEPNHEPGAQHTRAVEWLRTDVPRSSIDQDLLYSFGAFMTVCRIQRNDAENRIRALLTGGSVLPPMPPVANGATETDGDGAVDLEVVGRDLIRQRISQRFSGHAFEELVEHILNAQGYVTERTAEGADGGVDIVAGRGAMGFDPPRIAVQVKSSQQPEGESAIRELQGVLKRFGATHGLFVSWGGYKTSVLRRARELFFEIRLWDADDVIEAVLTHYEDLPDAFRADLPVKRIWTLVQESGE